MGKGSTPSQFKVWYAANREYRLSYMAEWRRKNRIRTAWLSARDRARKAGAVGEMTIEQLQARIDYYGGKCWICGAPWRHIDHVIPWVLGGTNWPANVRPACEKCNVRKAGRHPSDLSRPSKRGIVVKEAA